MWIEIAVVVAALTVIVGVVSQAVSTRRGTDRHPGETHGEQPGEAWTAAGPLDAAFPVERTPRERNIGDAAFVDGFLVGHYIAPLRQDEGRDPVQPERTALVPDGDDGTVAAFPETLGAAPSNETADEIECDLDFDLDEDAGYGAGVSPWDGSHEDTDDAASDDGFDNGFGFEDGHDDW